MPIPRPVYDISRPVRTGFPVWPGDAPCRIAWTLSRDEGAPVNVAELHMSAHCGTHVDAPFHVAGGARVGDLPLDAFLGPVVLVDVRGDAEIGVERAEEALALDPPVERVLFRTGCWTDPAVLPTRFPGLAPAAAARLRDAGVRLVGTDAPSVDPFDSEALPAHRVLGEAGIAIVENLLLDGVPPGAYQLLALPLRLPEADAAPLRALLRPR